jgi:hypothetical protein
MVLKNQEDVKRKLVLKNQGYKKNKVFNSLSLKIKIDFSNIILCEMKNQYNEKTS